MITSPFMPLIKKALFQPDLLSLDEREQYHQLLHTNEEVKYIVGGMIANQIKQQLEYKQSKQYACFTKLLKEVLDESFDDPKTYTLAQLLFDEFGIVLSEAEQIELYLPHEEEEMLLELEDTFESTRSVNGAYTLGNKLSSIIIAPNNGDDCTNGIVVKLSNPLDFSLTINIQDNKLNPKIDVEMPPSVTELEINFGHNKLLPGRYYCEITPNTTESSYNAVVICIFVQKGLMPKSVQLI